MLELVICGSLGTLINKRVFVGPSIGLVCVEVMEMDPSGILSCKISDVEVDGICAGEELEGKENDDALAISDVVCCCICCGTLP